MDYANNAIWGADYRRALANGDTAYVQKLQAAMDAQPQAANTAGMINALHLTNSGGDGANTWMNGADGQQVNGLGQIREAQATQGWNTSPGLAGALYSYNGQGAAPVASKIIGQAAPTMTQAQYGATLQQGAFPNGTGPFGAGTTNGTITNPGTTKSDKAALDLGGGPKIPFSGGTNPLSSQPTGTNPTTGGLPTTNTWTPWTPPATTGRSANFDIANSLWGSNAANYRNRKMAQLLKR